MKKEKRSPSLQKKQPNKGGQTRKRSSQGRGEDTYPLRKKQRHGKRGVSLEEGGARSKSKEKESEGEGREGRGQGEPTGAKALKKVEKAPSPKNPGEKKGEGRIRCANKIRSGGNTKEKSARARNPGLGGETRKGKEEKKLPPASKKPQAKGEGTPFKRRPGKAKKKSPKPSSGKWVSHDEREEEAPSLSKEACRHWRTRGGKKQFVARDRGRKKTKHIEGEKKRKLLKAGKKGGNKR